MKTVTGNLFDFMRPGDAMVHGCNTQGVMGSGIALEVKTRHPEAYNAYRLKYEAAGLQLGEIQPVFIPKFDYWVINGMTQDNFGRDGRRFASYDAISEVFRKIKEGHGVAQFNHLYFPLIGAGLGGGQWSIIEAIIKTELANANFDYTLVRFK